MDDFRLGAAIRAARRRRHWTQAELGHRAGVSGPTISRIERGHAGSFKLDTSRRVAAALEIQVRTVPLWRGGELDRLLNSAHSALHETVARRFRADWPDWTIAPEVSFSVYGERGVIDLLAWRDATRALLVIELKTQILDVNELLGTLDRKRRLARRVATERGWLPRTISTWLIVVDGRTNRRRVAAHAAVLRAALPGDGRSIRRFLRCVPASRTSQRPEPDGPDRLSGLAGQAGPAGHARPARPAGPAVGWLSFWPIVHGHNAGPGTSGSGRLGPVSRGRDHARPPEIDHRGRR